MAKAVKKPVEAVEEKEVKPVEAPKTEELKFVSKEEGKHYLGKCVKTGKALYI